MRTIQPTEAYCKTHLEEESTRLLYEFLSTVLFVLVNSASTSFFDLLLSLLKASLISHSKI